MNKNNTLVLAVSLALIATISAGVLACFDQITKEPRKAAKLRETTEALKNLQPQLNNNPFEKSVDIEIAGGRKVVFYPAEKDGTLLSVIGETISPIGYGGNMTVLAALAPDGHIQHVVVTSSNETPGLGTVVVERKQQKTLSNLFSEKKEQNPNTLPANRYLDQFDGKLYLPEGTKADPTDAAGIIPAVKFAVKKDGGEFDEVTGATVSSRACLAGVRDIAAAFIENRQKILAGFTAKPVTPENESR